MPRKAKTPELDTTPLPAAVEAAIQQDMAASAQLPAVVEQINEHQGVILAQYGDGLPYDRLRYVDKCRYHMARSAEEALEVGRCLIVMKECEGHGGWLPLLEEVGVGPDTAQRLMKVAVRFSNTASTRHLVDAAKSKTKLIELLVLDDEEMAALNDGESVRGLQLDDVERMSVSELRRELRKTRADKDAEVAKAKSSNSAELAAKDKLLADKTRRIAELVEEKNQRECMTDGERADELLKALNGGMLQAVGGLLPLRQHIDRIRALEHCPQPLYVAMTQALNQVLAEVEGIARDYGLGLDFGSAPWREADGDGFEDPNGGEAFGDLPSRAELLAAGA